MPTDIQLQQITGDEDLPLGDAQEFLTFLASGTGITMSNHTNAVAPTGCCFPSGGKPSTMGQYKFTSTNGNEDTLKIEDVYEIPAAWDARSQLQEYTCKCIPCCLCCCGSCPSETSGGGCGPVCMTSWIPTGKTGMFKSEDCVNVQEGHERQRAYPTPGLEVGATVEFNMTQFTSNAEGKRVQGPMLFHADNYSRTGVDTGTCCEKICMPCTMCCATITCKRQSNMSFDVNSAKGEEWYTLRNSRSCWGTPDDETREVSIMAGGKKSDSDKQGPLGKIVHVKPSPPVNGGCCKSPDFVNTNKTLVITFPTDSTPEQRMGLVASAMTVEANVLSGYFGDSITYPEQVMKK